MPRTELRARLVALAVGAAVGAVGRAAVTAMHLSPGTVHTPLILLIASAAGLLIGAIAGLARSPLAGAVIGVAVSGLLYVITLPVVMLFHLLGTLTTPSLLEVSIVGAVAGGAAGLVNRKAAHRPLQQTRSARG